MIYGSNNWKLTVRRDAEGVTILRALTSDVRAALPDTLFGLPVTALGDRALATGAPAAVGEELTIVGAPSTLAWDNRSLRELTLPPLLRRAGDYALMNCRALEAVRLTDRPVAWGVSALMNCRALNTVQISASGGSAGAAVAYFTGELSSELDISILSDGVMTARLIFPEYYEEYVENSPAHHFDYQIHGSGQPYHHVFQNRGLDFRAYDALWPMLLAGEHEPDTALRLAWWRVCCPPGLSDEAGARYRQYLAAHADAAIRYVLSLHDTALLGTLLRAIDCSAEALHCALDLARESRDTAAVAFLLEEQRHRSASGPIFDL